MPHLDPLAYGALHMQDFSTHFHILIYLIINGSEKKQNTINLPVPGSTHGEMKKVGTRTPRRLNIKLKLLPTISSGLGTPTTGVGT